MMICDCGDGVDLGKWRLEGGLEDVFVGVDSDAVFS